VSASPRPNTGAGPRPSRKLEIIENAFRASLPSWDTKFPGESPRLHRITPPSLIPFYLASSAGTALKIIRSFFKRAALRFKPPPSPPTATFKLKNPLSTHNMALAHRTSSRKSTFSFSHDHHSPKRSTQTPRHFHNTERPEGRFFRIRNKNLMNFGSHLVRERERERRIRGAEEDGSKV